MTPARRLLLGLIVVVSAGMALVAACHRTPWSDEGWMATPAHNLAAHGFMGSTTFPDDVYPEERIRQRTYWVCPGMILGLAAWYRIVPPTLVWTRLFSILWTPVLLLSVFSLVRRVTGDEPSALLATGLLGADFVLVSNAGFARPDVMCAALGFAALAAYLRLRRTNLALALAVSNALVMLSGMTHPNGILYLVALGILVIWHDRNMMSVRALLPSAAVYAAGAIAWAAYIFQDWPAFVAQIRRNSVGNSRFAKTLNPLSLVWTELRERYITGLGFDSPRAGARLKAASMFFAISAAAGACMTRKLRLRPGMPLLLTLLGAFFGAQTVFNQKLHFYLVHIAPLYLAVFAMTAVWLARSYPRLRAAVVLFIAALVLVQFGLLGAAATGRSTADDEARMRAFVATRLAHARTVYGSSALVFDLGFDERLVDDPLLGERSNTSADLIVADPNYRVRWDTYRANNPALMRVVETRLTEYQKAFENGSYQVYVRRGF